MSYKDIDPATLKTVIDTLAPYFHTKDVSEHQLMQQRHAAETQSRNYHADVGKAIKAASSLLNVQDQERKHARGTTWKKLGAATAPGKGA
jgi:hypothetical protein